MKYVALLSGGKDSCYNLLHCSRNGHHLIAAASLGPETGKEELDSYLYQTVGQDAIEFVAHALDVPLYRRVISGAAVEQGSEYGGRNAKDACGVLGDETEDLFALLESVKTNHPDVEGVSVGAILSNYQRVRIEHVDQADLLSEMIDMGMEAVLIKVAGIGLKPQHLGKTLKEMQPTLVKLNELYGSHICGEGGEYETLTIDCPMFKRRIELTEVEPVIHADNDFATVAFLRIKNAILKPKEEQDFDNIQIPSLLDDDLIRVQDAVLRSQETDYLIHLPSTAPAAFILKDVGTPSAPSSKRIDSWVAISDVYRDISRVPRNDPSIESEVKECFSLLKEQLARHNLTFANCANINIFISSMELFGQVNAVYGTFFGISPPARACVGIDFPTNIRVKLDCIAFVEKVSQERQSLHAITVEERIFISGQIGMIPSSLALPSPPSVAMETALAFQNAERITGALRTNSGGGWNGYTQFAVYWLVQPGDLVHVKAASEVYEAEVGVPTLFVAVKSLPKGALVEKQILSHTGRCKVLDDDADEYDEPSLQLRVPTLGLHAQLYVFVDNADLDTINSGRSPIRHETEDN
ncbi:hypothetical protein HWV62_40487 [Athelia sp. TMB]|nr:hypothetical protein HWV62_40487 [Athelia sp. TMB]